MDIADRMKENYEFPARHKLVRRMPVIVRVDGKAFHYYTKGFDKPFSRILMDSMVNAAISTARQMQGFKAAYIQSDEASFLLTDYDTLQTDAWFGYVQSKVESITASLFTLFFNLEMTECGCTKNAFFDARAFNVPREEVSNYFLWRNQDWERNSLSMYCRSFFSDKQMRGKSRTAQHEMLHEIGRNWATDLNPQQRNGWWIFKSIEKTFANVCIEPRFGLIDGLLDRHVDCDLRQAPPTYSATYSSTNGA